jgi:gamma-glutamyl-gamma-aminobutyrate hydrolase PuuD
MKKLRIGILAIAYASTNHKTIYGVAQSYMLFASRIQQILDQDHTSPETEVRVVTPDQSPDELDLDLLILPGGPDLSLAIRPENASYIGQGKDCQTYTAFYSSELFDKWVESKIPMFGICLGSQALANHFDSPLFTHGEGHQIKFNDNHAILQVADSEVGTSNHIIDVNSRHHQFILAHGFNYTELVPLAFGYAYESSLKTAERQSRSALARIRAGQVMGQPSDRFSPFNIEAFRHKTLKIAAVQWHPEDMVKGIWEIGDNLTHDILAWLLSDRVNPTATEAPKPTEAYA